MKVLAALKAMRSLSFLCATTVKRPAVPAQLGHGSDSVRVDSTNNAESVCFLLLVICLHKTTVITSRHAHILFDTHTCTCICQSRAARYSDACQSSFAHCRDEWLLARSNSSVCLVLLTVLFSFSFVPSLAAPWLSSRSCEHHFLPLLVCTLGSFENLLGCKVGTRDCSCSFVALVLSRTR